MRRTCFVLAALLVALWPAVWARAMAGYPGWSAEVALRAAGCDSISTRLSGWTGLPGATSAAVAATTAERLAAKLGFAGTALTTPDLVLITGTQPGATATIAANLRDSLWLLTAEVTCAGDASAWYDSLRDALAATGYPGPVHISVFGLRPGRLTPGWAALMMRTVCGGMLARTINAVTDGSGGKVVSGTAGLVPRQPGIAGQGGSFALSLNFSEAEQATVITVGVPGLR